VHELSIAMSLVEIAIEEQARLGAPRVLVVHVEVGALSGVVPDALAFAFEVATADTPVAGARLEIEPVAAAIRCDACGAERTLPSVQHLRCPVCDAPALHVTRGRELALTALEVDDCVAENR
jgi:hydrogenase nickel incorporation protein HypA/HybF